jgi:predicted porin
MKKVLMATTALAIVAASASAVDVEMYGQVNKNALTVDDGRNTDTVFVDNHKSESRFGLKGAQALDNGLTASFLLESAIASNPSNAFTQSTATTNSSTPAVTANTASFAERQARVGLSGAWGGAYLGHQSTAIDSVRDQDLVGVRDVMGSSYASDFGSSLAFRANGTGATVAGRTIAGAGAPDVQDRAQSVRYDSPIFAGLQGRASFEQGGNFDGSVFYDGALAGLKTKAALGQSRINNSANNVANNVSARTDASVSVAHASGLAGTLGYNRLSLANKATGQDTPTSWYAKAGYAWDAYEVAADYGHSSHYSSTTANATPLAVVNSDKLTSFGVGAQYNMGQGVSVAALYRNFSMDRTGFDLSDINMYGVNMRVKF